MKIREYAEKDVPDMIHIWNQVVEDGVAFPQEECLDGQTGPEFFAAQDYCGVAGEDGRILGLYILHPNSFGRLGHIANASYAVDAACRGCHIGEKLVTDCLAQAKRLGFSLMQFNAVVKENHRALHLYEKLGFQRIGEVPGGFLMKDGHYADIVLFYYVL